MSIPDDTPAAVTTFPCSTTRSSVGSAPNSRSRSWNIQCVVARRPFRTPAAPRTSDPVHTEVVHWVVWWIVRTHSRMAGSRSATSWPGPPGTTKMSALGTEPMS